MLGGATNPVIKTLFLPLATDMLSIYYSLEFLVMPEIEDVIWKLRVPAKVPGKCAEVRAVPRKKIQGYSGVQCPSRSSPRL